MFIDALTKVSTSQVTGAAAVSTNSIDLGASTPKRQVGTGEALSFAVNVEVAPTGVSLQVEVISATDAALTAGVLSHASRTILAADAPIGSVHAIEVPIGTPSQRYLGLRYTVPTGTSTVSAHLTKHDMVSAAPVAYAKNYAV